MKITHKEHEHVKAIFRSDGVFLDYQQSGSNRILQEFVPYNELTLEFTNPVQIRIKKANNFGLWYKELVGQEFTAEAVNKGHMFPFNDFILIDGRLINFIDCEIVE